MRVALRRALRGATSVKLYLSGASRRAIAVNVYLKRHVQVQIL